MLLTEDKEAGIGAERKEVRIGKESVVEVKQTMLFYTQAFSYYLQNPLSKRLIYTSILEQAVGFWRDGLWSSAAIEKMKYDAP